MLKQKNGITLIALVVTIIVLLILAGVSISMVTGESGIAKKASDSKEETRAGEVQELVDLWKTEVYAGKQVEWENVLTEEEFLMQLINDGKVKENEIYRTEKVIKIANREISYKIASDEKNPPVLVINPSTTGKSLTLEITATDEESNLDKIIWYYKLNEGEYLTEEVKFETETKGPETISKTWELDKGTPFYAYVKVYDVNGNYVSTKEENEVIAFYIGYETSFAYNGMKWKELVDRDGFYISSSGYVEYEKNGSTTDRSYHSNQMFGEDLIKSGFIAETSGVAECVFPESQIFTSFEGQYVLAKDLKQGNDILYYNFETNEVEIGKVENVYVHKNATNFVKYIFEDGTYLEATDYHPIYTKNGWKSYTQRNGYEVPQIGNMVRTKDGWKKIIGIESWIGLEDCYDFAIVNNAGELINNYYANNTLVQGSY